METYSIRYLRRVLTTVLGQCVSVETGFVGTHSYIGGLINCFVKVTVGGPCPFSAIGVQGLFGRFKRRMFTMGQGTMFDNVLDGGSCFLGTIYNGLFNLKGCAFRQTLSMYTPSYKGYTV